MQNVDFPDEKLEVIEESAFAECNSFTSIYIPMCVAYVRNEAFARCMNVTNATIANCATNVHKYAFRYVENLQAVCVATLTFTMMVYEAVLHHDVLRLAGLISVMFLNELV